MFLLHFLLLISITSLDAAPQAEVFLDTAKAVPEWGFTKYSPLGRSKNGWTYENNVYKVCDTDVEAGENWLFSNYISLSNQDGPVPSQIKVKIMFSIRNCSSVASSSRRDNVQCSNQLEVYYAKMKSETPPSYLQDKFKKLSSLEVNSDTEYLQTDITKDGDPNKLLTSYLDIDLADKPATDGDDKGLSTNHNYNGIYLAFKDSQSCSFIREVTITAKFCPTAKISLAHYPKTWISHENVKKQGECVEGAEEKTWKPYVLCLKEGSWEDNRQYSDYCLCKPGYEPNGNKTQCQECARGYYKSEHDNSKCLKCPMNSVAQSLGQKVCECVSSYYRANDSVDAVCSKPPGPPQNVKAVVRHTEVQLSWLSPYYNDGGGSASDLWFIVRCPDCLNSGASHQFDKYGHSKKPIRIHELPFVITGLRPRTRYEFEVFTVNSLVQNVGLSQLKGSVPIYAITKQEVKIYDLKVKEVQNSGIVVTWEVTSPLLDENYEITLISPNNNEEKYYSRGQQSYLLQSLDQSGEWKLLVCATNIRVCSESMTVAITASPPFASMSATNLAIAAALLITVILTMLLVLVTAVCCYRRNVTYKWANGSPTSGYTCGTLAGANATHYNLMDITVPLDNGNMKLFYPGPGAAFGEGQQAFVDPTYYDDVDKILMEFTREIQCNQLQPLDGSFGVSPHQSSSKISLELSPNSNITQLSMTEQQLNNNGWCDNRAILYHSETQKSIVRIRTCDESNIGSSGPQELRLFALECATMSQFYHPNVLMLHGVAYDGPKVYMCVEDTSHGNLDTYLKTYYNEVDGGLTQLQLMHLLRGVACGMQYLSELGYIHKVLCASNVLMSGSGLCKIAGFEYRVLLEEEETTQTNCSKVFDALMGWFAPEVLACRKWSSASDVWSFGTLAWETLSHCQLVPLSITNSNTKSTQELVKSLEYGNRLPLPEGLGVSHVLYESVILNGCWNLDRNQRLNFAQIRDLLERSIRNPSQMQEIVNNANSKSFNPYYFSTISRGCMMSSNEGGAGRAASNSPYAVSFRQQPQPQSTTASPFGGGGGGVGSYSVQEWLHSLKMDQYVHLLTAADYLTVDDVVCLDNRCLHRLGITSNKHRKLIMNSIEAIRSRNIKMMTASSTATTANHQAAYNAAQSAPNSLKPQSPHVSNVKETAVHVIM